MVQLVQLSGLEMNAYLVLEEKPNRQEQKLKTLSNYVQQYPSGWKKRLELADRLYSSGQWQQAVQEYRQVLVRQPRLMDVCLQLGKILHLMGNNTEAIAAYQNALPLSHHISTQQHINGLIEACRDRPFTAVQLFSCAASAEPDNPAHWYALAQVHLDAESPVAALRAFEAVLSLNPDDAVALSQSCPLLLVSGNFQEAERRLERTIELAPNDCRAIELLATYRCHRGLISGDEGKHTKQLIKAALALTPNSASAHQVLSFYHLCRGERDKAIALLLEFTQAHPKSPNGWYHYARCLFHTSNSQAAADAILKAYALYQKDSEIYRALCEILPAAGRLEEFRINSPDASFNKGGQEHQPIETTSPSLIEEMLERFPHRWSIWVTAGRVLVETFKDCDRGCVLSAKGPQLQPDLADAWFRHGRVLALAGRHQEAVEVMLRGWECLSEGGYVRSLPAVAWLAESYRELGEEAKSRRWWEAALHLAKTLKEFNPVTADYWQGKVLLALGDRSGAKQAYRKALSEQLFYPARSEVKDVLKHL